MTFLIPLLWQPNVASLAAAQRNRSLLLPVDGSRFVALGLADA